CRAPGAVVGIRRRGGDISVMRLTSWKTGLVLCAAIVLAAALGGAAAGSPGAGTGAAGAPVADGSAGCTLVAPAQGTLSLQDGMVVGALSFRCASGYRPAGVRITLEYHDPYGAGWAIVLDQVAATLS